MLAAGGTVNFPIFVPAHTNAMPPVTIFTAGASGLFILSQSRVRPET